jgi:methylated-DNA-[protein]-cysteine S-methyltransferase
MGGLPRRVATFLNQDAFTMKRSASLTQTTIETPLGPMLLAVSSRGLAGVWFINQQHFPTLSETGSWATDASQPLLLEAACQLASYFHGDSRSFDVPLDLSAGTAFQQSVWRALTDIPPGTTQSYGTIAQRVGRPAAVRAVGAAIGRNPLGIVVPCHRVIGANGSLTGYAGGLDRKKALLALEGAAF